MTRSRDGRRRVLVAEEHALWSKAMAGVKPLRRAAPRALAAAGPAASAPLPPPRAATAPAIAPVATPGAAPRPVAAKAAVDRSLGIDKNTLARLKRGDMPIDGRLDLHGMTQAPAHGVLDRFIESGVQRGARLLLVITGKGVGGDGVLRQMLPRWLRAGPHAARILRIEPAHLRHGGGGAWYVYLRRRRPVAAER